MGADGIDIECNENLLRIAAGGSNNSEPEDAAQLTARTGVTQDGAAPDEHR
ncbi:hypothetical protein W911_02745 [Hyphomicrobium nitrativorans NL23]|uniref:Uncharacterized protein n=1 Tax=Hyphomicrobium nitrativorans NL23 TaxID=1029756 RepID=V5SIV8_9HYPH|nr:hypothetical protein W911_02745 [Hyphomicrobium nitrativorans NL23]